MEPMYIYTTAKQIKKWYKTEEELPAQKEANVKEPQACSTCHKAEAHPKD